MINKLLRFLRLKHYNWRAKKIKILYWQHQDGLISGDKYKKAHDQFVKKTGQIPFSVFYDKQKEVKQNDK